MNLSQQEEICKKGERVPFADLHFVIKLVFGDLRDLGLAFGRLGGNSLAL